MRGLLAGLCVISVNCTQAAPPPYSPVLTVEPVMSDRNVPYGDGSVPYRDGGAFTVRVDAKVGGMCGGAHGLVEISDPSQPVGAVTSAAILLHPTTSACDDLQADAQLVWPPGGRIPLRVTAVGIVKYSDVILPAPELTIRHGLPSPKGLSIAVPTCVDTSAAVGRIVVNLIDAVTANGQQQFTSPIAPGPCPPGTAETLHSADGGAAESEDAGDGGADTAVGNIAFSSVTSRASFHVSAALLGTQVQADKTIDVVPVGKVDLAVTAASPPPKGQAVVAITVTAMVKGTLAAGIPIAFETTPQTEVLPSTVVSDAAGRAGAWVLLPEDAQEVRVDAVAGNARGGAVISR